MNDLTDPAGIAALSAGAVALIALLLALVLAVRVRRLRAAQRTVLGEHGDTDLVAHAASPAPGVLRARTTGSRRWRRNVDERLGAAEARLDGAIAYRSLVRYDAYGELTGNQSTTIALLDAERNGVVLSSIVRRDTARIYCKQVVDGRGELELSPEEAEAVRRALAGESAATLQG